MVNFVAKTKVFEGPLDVLLDLIEKRKLLINEISLAGVTDDFIKHIEENPSLPVEEKAEFIVIASTLILIKSKSLLPNINLENEEEESIEKLEERLKLYKKFKELSEKIKEIFLKDRIFFAEERQEKEVVFSPHKKITLDSLEKSLQSVILKIPVEKKNPEVSVKKVISIEEMIERLTLKVQSSLKMSFKEFTGKGSRNLSKEDKIEVIISFIALLELVKQGTLDVIQNNNFDEIEIKTESIDIPRYTN